MPHLVLEKPSRPRLQCTPWGLGSLSLGSQCAHQLALWGGRCHRHLERLSWGLLHQGYLPQLWRCYLKLCRGLHGAIPSRWLVGDHRLALLLLLEARHPLKQMLPSLLHLKMCSSYLTGRFGYLDLERRDPLVELRVYPVQLCRATAEPASRLLASAFTSSFVSASSALRSSICYAWGFGCRFVSSSNNCCIIPDIIDITDISSDAPGAAGGVGPGGSGGVRWNHALPGGRVTGGGAVVDRPVVANGCFGCAT